jgi:NAD(P)-dependent dehydrogenase (short-subunit alcohol dehydrogenase family)
MVTARSFAQRNVVITGGGSGIGLASADLFLARGARVVINGRNIERGANAVAALEALAPGKFIRFVAADVSEPASARELFRAAREAFGGDQIDILVNCIGADTAPQLFHKLAAAEVALTLDGWLKATILSCAAALPHLRDGGAIVNVASDAGKAPTPGETVIGAAMAGIVMFRRTLALEQKRRGVRANAITPSFVPDTQTSNRVTAEGMGAKLYAKAKAAAHLGLPTARDVANAVLFFASDEAQFVTGQVLSVNGGIST